jgi:histone-lysine N-methyltransferase SETMAR
MSILRTNATQASRKIFTAFGEDTVSERTAQKWFRKFVSGDDTFEDAPRDGQPTITDDNELKAATELDSSHTCQEPVEIFNVSDETIHLHLQRMGKVYKLSKWIPHELTADNKLQRLLICLSLLSRHNNEPFLDWLLTYNEKWLLYSNIRRSCQWLSSSEYMPHTLKPAIHQQKVFLCIWWNTADIIHYELPPPGQTIREVYSAHLYQVHDALLQKQPVLVNPKGIIFLQDDKRLHTTQVTWDKLHSLGWEILSHTPYYPDISPSDYRLFFYPWTIICVAKYFKTDRHWKRS